MDFEELNQSEGEILYDFIHTCKLKKQNEQNKTKANSYGTDRQVAIRGELSWEMGKTGKGGQLW